MVYVCMLTLFIVLINHHGILLAFGKMNEPEQNRIGGWKGLQMNMTCWDVLSEIYKSENDKKGGCERQWFLRRKECDK